ncbi:MAG: energy-coupling factor ABC transporter permease [Planctomycetes bacterium]|nr:energy-coupling factor ABC transporter permease [Planctomycetota bacterium]
MHIPDGFLDTKTWASLSAVSAGFVALSVVRANRKLGEKHVPLMGIMSAFIFSTQMLNFPVAGGTSGHFMGAVLAAVLLGPFAGTLIMSIVLVVQCLMFADGGITALGANIFNMGVVGSLSGYLIYFLLSSVIKGKPGKLIGVFVASWASIVLASGACALELAFSGTIALNIALPAMAGVHMIIGIGEALITTAVLTLILAVRPDLLELTKI